MIVRGYVSVEPFTRRKQLTAETKDKNIQRVENRTEAIGPFRSLKKRILVPLALASLGVIVAVLVVAFYSHTKALQNRVLLKAQMLAHSATMVIDHIEHTRDVQRTVEEFDAMPEVTEIVVVMGNPPVVIGSTHKDWLGRTVWDIPEKQTITDLMESISQLRDDHLIHDATREFSYSSPLYCHDDECTIGKECNGAVMVHIDLKPMEAELIGELWESLAQTAIGLLLLTLLVFVMVERRVIQPVMGINLAMKSRRSGDTKALAPIVHNDEIGQMASTLNQAVNEISAREQQLKSLLANDPGAVYRASCNDGARTAIFISDHIRDITGYSPSDIVTGGANSITSIVHPADRQRVAAEINTAITLQQAYQVEYRIDHVDGSLRWVMERGAGIRDSEGNICCLDGMIMDITNIKRAEEQLRSSEERFDLALQGTLDGIWDWDLRANTVYYSDRYRALLGFTHDEFPNILESFINVLHPEDSNRVLEAIQEHLKYRIPFDTEFRMQTKAGGYGWFQSRAQAVWDDNDTPLRLTGALTDITERKAAETILAQRAVEIEHKNAELEEALFRAEAATNIAAEASKAKSQFLATMSHEIRTPMNGIMGMTNLTLETPLTDLQRDYLDMVKASADHLLGIIDDILDFSKIEAGRMTIYPVDASLRETVETAVDAIILKSREKELELIVFTDPAIPDAVSIDPLRFRQILVNIVGNAVKFTESGEVSVRLEIKKEDGTDYILTTVADTGIGIPQNQQDRIFDSFTQADGTTTRQYGGTGLGTTIAKQLVEMMGGRIWVNSPTNTSGVGGPGTTFSFTVPFCKATAPVVTANVQDIALDGKRVLIVDDNKTNCVLLSALSMNWHMTPTVSWSGEEAIDLIHDAVVADSPFDLILCDVLMPGTSGIDIANACYERGWLASSALVLLSSDFAHTNHKTRDGRTVIPVVRKPIRERQLREAIANQMNCSSLTIDTEKTNLRVDTSASSPSRNGQFRILVAEDNLINMRLAESLLTKKGYQVTGVVDGEKALTALISQSFDLVLMDIQMPLLGGLETTRKIRESELGTGKHLPIIAMTANAMEEDRRVCISAGCDDYIAKPVSAEVLYALIEKHLTKNNPALKSPA